MQTSIPYLSPQQRSVPVPNLASRFLAALHQAVPWAQQTSSLPVPEVSDSSWVEWEAVRAEFLSK